MGDNISYLYKYELFIQKHPIYILRVPESDSGKPGINRQVIKVTWFWLMRQGAVVNCILRDAKLSLVVLWPNFCNTLKKYLKKHNYNQMTFIEYIWAISRRILYKLRRQPRWLSGLTRSCVHSLWLLVNHCVLSNWDRILVRAVKGLISRAGMVSICPLLWQRDVKLQQTIMYQCTSFWHSRQIILQFTSPMSEVFMGKATW